MSLLKRLISFLKTKNSLVKEIESLNKMLGLKFKGVSENLMSLSQDKIYFLYCEGLDEQELNNFADILLGIQDRICWTVPPIILLSNKINSYTEQDLKNLLALKKRGKDGENKGSVQVYDKQELSKSTVTTGN